MRKSILSRETGKTEGGWFELTELARVELSSEEPSHPIEAALRAEGAGWRAAEPGQQTIRLIFDEPQRVRRIRIEFREEERPRTQEFVLRWSDDAGQSYREIVRQQYNFSPAGSSVEREEYTVDLPGVTALELELIPDLGRSAAKASLARLQIG